MSIDTCRTFDPDIPPDLEHAALIREEALGWLETTHRGKLSFSTGDVLRMVGEESRRWLITRLREHGIGGDDGFSLPAAADALTVMFLRSKGVKFREAVDAVRGRTLAKEPDPGYGGLWKRLLMIALNRLTQRTRSRLLGSTVFAAASDAHSRDGHFAF